MKTLKKISVKELEKMKKEYIEYVKDMIDGFTGGIGGSIDLGEVKSDFEDYLGFEIDDALAFSIERYCSERVDKLFEDVGLDVKIYRKC